MFDVQGAGAIFVEEDEALTIQILITIQRTDAFSAQKGFEACYNVRKPADDQSDDRTEIDVMLGTFRYFEETMRIHLFVSGFFGIIFYFFHLEDPFLDETRDEIFHMVGGGGSKLQKWWNVRHGGLDVAKKLLSEVGGKGKCLVGRSIFVGADHDLKDAYQGGRLGNCIENVVGLTILFLQGRVDAAKAGLLISVVGGQATKTLVLVSETLVLFLMILTESSHVGLDPGQSVVHLAKGSISLGFEVSKLIGNIL